jgi:hypothetical protein
MKGMSRIFYCANKCITTPCTQMGRAVRFEFFTKFYVYLPFTKARLPCLLVMAGIRQMTKHEYLQWWINETSS